MMILGFILFLILNYVYICRVYADAWGSQKRAWEPWRWISKQLFAAQYGHWEPNICPMEEQQVLLTTEPDQPHQHYTHITYLLRIMLLFFKCYGFYTNFLSGYFCIFVLFLFFIVTQCHLQGCEVGALTTESCHQTSPGSSCFNDLTPMRICLVDK